MNTTTAILQQASDFCTTHTHRFTPPRQKVLRVIAESKVPIGAYDIIAALQSATKNVKPPTVYRAISFWEKHGFIHRIEGLNAYALCQEGHLHTGSQFMICDTCGKAQEIHMCHMPEHITHYVEQHSFTPRRWNLEIYGLCRACAA